MQKVLAKAFKMCIMGGMNKQNAYENTCVGRIRQHFGKKKKILASFGITRQAFDNWIHNGICSGYVQRLLDVERQSGGVVTAEQIIAEARKRQ